MPNNKSTAPATNDAIQISTEHCVNMQPFFDLIEGEIKRHNNTDFDSIDFLVKAAKAEYFRFGNLVYELQESKEAAQEALNTKAA